MRGPRFPLFVLDDAHVIGSWPFGATCLRKSPLGKVTVGSVAIVVRPSWVCNVPGAAASWSIRTCYLVDPASSHMLVSKIKPCMCKYELIRTVKLRMAH